MADPRASSPSTPGSFKIEPLPLSAFPLGDGPFRVRGLAYATLLDYVDKRLPGGRPALMAALGPADPWLPYIDQLFVVGADYDASPLCRLFVAAARVRGEDVARFVEKRAQQSAKTDVHGMWKPLLKTSSPEAMAERLHIAFNRYFRTSTTDPKDPACEAKPISVVRGRFEAELGGLPAPLAGVHVWSTRGFVTAALTLAGAREPTISLGGPIPDGRFLGVPLLRVRLVSNWS